MIQIPQSTARVVMLKVFDTGTTTAATGKTVAITISKAGGAFGNPNAGATNATEVSAGWYKVTLDTTDTGTVGDLVVRGTATGCDATERIFGVVKATNGGLTGIPDAAADAAGGLPISDAGGLDLDAKLANTNEVTAARMGALTDWIDGGRLDLILDGASTLTQTQVTGGAYALNSASFAFNSGLDFTTAQKAATLARVTLTDTVTTYTGNTPQTGDSFARIGATGSGLTSLAPSATALTSATWTGPRAGYLDNLSAGAVPTLAQILAGGDVDGYTLEQTLKLCLAALAGKLSGAATTTVTIRSAADDANRIVATVDADGNRSAVTLNAAG